MTTLAPTAPQRTLLSESQLCCWREGGYLILPRFFPQEQIAEAAAEADELLVRHRPIVSTSNLRCRYQPIVASGEQEFECFDPVIDLSLTCHRLALDPPFSGGRRSFTGKKRACSRISSFTNCRG